MKVFSNISEFKTQKKTIITLGTFDGVHKGHQAILAHLIDNSKKEKLESLVLTFFPHPRAVISETSTLKLLNTIAEKQELFSKIGIDNFIIHPFDHTFSELTPEEFVKQVLVDRFNVAKIIIGYDHKFGKNRAADFNDLKAFGAKFGFEVEEISAQQINAIAISSTKIRMALQEGNIELANQYLGYPYMLSGKVLKGNQLGRTIGFPTANIHLTETYKLIPKIGVYVVAVYIENKAYYGMMNIGTRPTIDGQNLSIEVHIFNFEQTIYDASIKVHMLKKLRDEQKFESLEILKNQLHQDKIDALAYISKLKIK